jgi:hypothetical protein
VIKKILSASAILAFAATTAAGANTSTGTIAANLAIQSTCAVTNTGAGFQFGVFESTASAQTSDAWTQISYACSNANTTTVAPALNLSDAKLAGSNPYFFTLTGTGHTIAFGIKQSSDLSTTFTADTGLPFQDSTDTQTISATIASGNVDLVAEASIGANQPVDNYSDSVVATLTIYSD